MHSNKIGGTDIIKHSTAQSSMESFKNCYKFKFHKLARPE